MRRTFVVLIVTVLALALAGCGGGGETATPPTQRPATSAPTPAPGTAPVLTVVPDRSVNASPTFVPFPSGEFVPADLKAGIVAKRPTIILFHDASYTSATTREIIDQIRKEDRGVIDLVVYDLGRYVKTSPTGEIAIDSTLTADASAQQPVLLARALGVTAVPFVVVTDTQGYIIWKYRGLVDKALLTREVRRATQ